MPTLDFVENAAIWTFAGLLAITGTPLAAIAFLTVAPKFVIAMRTGNLGAVATIYVDGIPAAVADTYSDTPGVIRKIIFGDPDNDTHQVYVQKDDNPDTILEVIRKELSPDEVTPPYIRYNVDCDCTQITTDGGATWTDSPAADPRANPGQLVPPLGTVSPRCDAAANMVAKLHAMVDADITSANALLLSSILLDLALLAFPGAGDIADLFLIIAEAIIAIGSATISSAFTSAVYDDLLCTFFDNIGTDGQMDSTQYASLNATVSADYDFIVGTVFNLHSQSLGFVGWSNAGALGTETGDCDPCSPCSTFDYSVEPMFYTYFAGSWSAGAIVQACAGSDSTSNYAFLFNDGTCETHKIASVIVSATVIGSATDVYVYGLTTCSRTSPTGQILLASGLGVTGDFSSDSADMTTDFYGFQIITSTAGGCGTSDVHITAFEYCRA